MPQNVRTQPIYLTQAQFEQVAAFPAHATPRGDYLFGGLRDTYHVVDVQVQDGRTYTGLLIVGGDVLLLPVHEPAFAAEDIAAMTPTPATAMPDFTITDAAALWHRGGILHEDAWRLHAFGPPPAAPARIDNVEEAHAEALEDDARIVTFGGEIPASYHGIHGLTLTADGLVLHLARINRRDPSRHCCWPTGADLWSHLLREPLTLPPEGVPLGQIARLLDLPPTTDYEVALAVLGYGERSLRPWVEAVQDTTVPRDDTLATIEVMPTAHADDEGYHFGFDAVGRGAPLAADDPETGERAGTRPRWSLSYSPPAQWCHVPVHYRPELVLPVDHEEEMAFLRGPYRAWQRAGGILPAPEYPVRFRTRRTITLGDFLEALLTELSPRRSQDTAP